MCDLIVGVLEDNPRPHYRTVSDIWNDDYGAQLAAFGTPEYQVATQGIASHCASRSPLHTEEEIIIE